MVFSSCKEITKDDIKGDWIAMSTGNDEPIFNEISFKENKVELIGDDLFKESGVYEVKNESIILKLDRDTAQIETKIKSLVSDTLVVFDSLIYHRDKRITKSTYEEYELLGINTNTFLPKEGSFFYIIHFYKSSNDEIQIRCGDKKSNFEDIPLFLERRNSKPIALIYLGTGINLKDLKNLYYRLASIRQLKVLLGTKKEGISRTHIIIDDIQIWREDLENHVAKLDIIQPLPPPPPVKYNSKNDYLKSGGKEIRILHKNDIDKLRNLVPNNKYVISINQNLPIRDYIALKKVIREESRIHNEIITEIE